jgi:5-methylcytosine-specific restriction endonuclease McrA
MTRKFRNDEQGYLAWIYQHPDGFVLNATKSISPSYFVLHRSICPSINKATTSQKSDAFTGQRYIKVCAARIESLERWIKQHKGQGITKECGRCEPTGDGSGAMPRELLNETFQDAVERSKRSSSQERQSRLAHARKQPRSVYVKEKVFLRNPDVVAEVLIRAKGRCEGEECRSRTAPFKRRKDGTPYLEVHHLKRLADGGEDSVENARALCPNCHRKAHYG